MEHGEVLNEGKKKPLNVTEVTKNKRGAGPFGVSDEEVEKLQGELKAEEVKKSTKLKRELFLRVMRKTTNISIACAVIGISRRTFYRWLEGSERFAALYEDVLESKVDFAESALFVAAGKQERWAVQEILRSKRGKKRGYGKTLELGGLDGGPIPVKLYEGIDDSGFPEPKDKPKGEE
jgi:hypothetical protein